MQLHAWCALRDASRLFEFRYAECCQDMFSNVGEKLGGRCLLVGANALAG